MTYHQWMMLVTYTECSDGERVHVFDVRLDRVDNDTDSCARCKRTPRDLLGEANRNIQQNRGY